MILAIKNLESDQNKLTNLVGNIEIAGLLKKEDSKIVTPEESGIPNNIDISGEIPSSIQVLKTHFVDGTKNPGTHKDYE